MKIKLKSHVTTAAGAGKPGDIVDWPNAAQALVDGECAEWYTPEMEAADAAAAKKGKP